MRVFAGRQAGRPMWQGRHSRPNYKPEQIITLIEQKSVNRVRDCLKGILVMERKTIVTLASVAAITCSLLAFSWVGLALLGF
jgi:hypothetical protein